MIRTLKNIERGTFQFLLFDFLSSVIQLIKGFTCLSLN